MPRPPSSSLAPLVGVTGRRRSAGQIAGFPASLDDFGVDLFLADYSVDVLGSGALPVPLPLDADPAAYVGHLDGVVLTGGADIEPGRYGHEPDGCGAYEPERDGFELALLEAALAAELPVLGICRGLQLLNVAAGGTLHQHVPSHNRLQDDPAMTVHEVRFTPTSRLGLLYGETLDVNSLHHQSVADLGTGLAVTATADDGTVEGLEMPGHDVIAVQWHPEMRPHREPVFDWLAKRAADLRASRTG